jgi:spore coat protein U-like protein
MKPASTRDQPPFSRSRDASPIGVRALVAVLLSVVAAPAIAAGTVSCSVSAAALSFGSYDVFAASPITSTTTLSVTCTLTSGGATTVTYVVALSSGSSNTFVQRQMKNGANALGYNLYSDSARTTVWGDGTGGTQTVSQPQPMQLKPPTPVLTDNFTVYGNVPALQDVAVGAYSDNITITLTY